MSKRERTLAFLLLPPLVLFGGAFLVYQLWIEPLQARDRQISKLHSDIEEKQGQLKKSQDKAAELARVRAASLPADAETSRREYEEQLAKMAHDSGFEPGTFPIVSKPIDAKSSPMLNKTKPIYTRLVYTVQAKGELASLIDFMEKFYQLPLLHAIRNISLQRPINSDRNRGNDLDINMTIEALILDGAEHRKALLPEKAPELPQTLAAGERKYPMIAGRDIFFGPPAPAAARKESTTDFAQFIKFVSYSDSEGGLTASLFDAYNKQEITIRPRADGDGFRIEVTSPLGGRQLTLRSGRTIDIYDENQELQHHWMVLKMAERDIYLQDDEAYYVLHLGQWMSEMHKLTSEEASAMGLVAAKTSPPEDKTKQ